MPRSRNRFNTAERQARAKAVERRRRKLARAKRLLALRAGVISLAMEQGRDDLAADVAAMVVEENKRRRG